MKNNEITLDGIDYEKVIDGDDVILQSIFQDITLPGCWYEAKDAAEKALFDSLRENIEPRRLNIAMENITESDIDFEAWRNLDWHILNFKHERVITLNI